MRKYTLTINPSKVDFAPADVLTEIFQNVNTILNTAKFSVPLFREFGNSALIVDKPMTTIRPTMIAEIVEVVEKYEPRVLVEEIKMNGEIDGILHPTITISIKSGVEI